MTLESNFQLCVDGFDARVNAAVNVDRINFNNDMLGGQRPGGSRILFINGGIDPWHSLSVTPFNIDNPNNAAVFIPSGAHCRQMLPSQPSDPEDVKLARLQCAAMLQAWMQE
jgi:serine protease 16